MREETLNKEMAVIPLRKVWRIEYFFHSHVQGLVLSIEWFMWVSVAREFGMSQQDSASSSQQPQVSSTIHILSLLLRLRQCCCHLSLLKKVTFSHTPAVYALSAFMVCYRMSMFVCIYWSDAGSVGAAGRWDCSVSGGATVCSVFV